MTILAHLANFFKLENKTIQQLEVCNWVLSSTRFEKWKFDHAREVMSSIETVNFLLTVSKRENVSISNFKTSKIYRNKGRENKIKIWYQLQLPLIPGKPW